MTSKILQLRLDQIRLDGSTQMRVELDSGVAAEYAENYRQKIEMPDPEVFFDGSHYWMADGFTRWHGMRQAGMKCAVFRVFTGTQRDAFLYAAGCNVRHGQRRRPEDVRHCVRRLLEDEEWGRWSNAEIGRQCKCDQRIVADEKKKLKEEKERRKAATSTPEKAASHHSACNGEGPKETVIYRTKHGTTATMDVSKSSKDSKNGYRERPVYPETEPKQLEKLKEQLARSPKKCVRQAKAAGWSLETLLDAIRDWWEKIPMAEAA